MADTKQPAKKADKRAGRETPSTGWTKEERAAMKEHAKELKASASRADGEQEVLAKIKEMPKADRDMAQRIHEIVKETAPDLVPRTWYGMPAYASDGNVLCFFQPADKFKARYATFGFNDAAKLDDGAMWATSFALKKLSKADEKKLGELVRKAVS